MSNDTFTIDYSKSLLNAVKSEVTFYNETPDLKSFYFSENSNKTSKRLFITDAKVASLECMQSFIELFSDGIYQNDSLIILGSGEAYKNIDTVISIIKTAMELGFNNKDCFIGIGGGVVCDITAFAASIYKQGVPVELVPTTLLAMIDASIGGKTGCDIEKLKNMIGTFYPARKISIFIDFTKYTSNQQYNSGLAQAFRMAFLGDKTLFEVFKNESEKLINRDKDFLNKIVTECVKIKADIIQKDPSDDGIAANLSYGHTFARALESTVGLGTITEGEAIAWGMSRSLTLSWNKGYCNEAFKDEILKTLELYGWDTKPIPSIVKGGGVSERILNAMHMNKKNPTEKIRLILPIAVGKAKLEDIDDSDILAILK